jgi:predicted transcriptional regulator
MKRTTVKIPDDLDARLRHTAAARGVTIAEVVRDALEAHLADDRSARMRAIAAGSGRSDVSEHIERILRDEWGQRS